MKSKTKSKMKSKIMKEVKGVKGSAMAFISAIVVLSGIAAAGCTSSSEDQSAGSEVVKLDLEEAVKGARLANLSKFASDIKYIPLETGTESQIDKVNEFRYSNGKIYMMVGELNENWILVFDGNGNFLKKLHKSGRGPGEYIRLGDIAVLEDNTIALISINKMLAYNLENDSLVFETSFDKITEFSGNKRFKAIDASAYLGDGKYAVTTLTASNDSVPERNMLCLIDQESNILQSAELPPYRYVNFKVQDGMITLSKIVAMYMYDNSIHVPTSSSDTIYRYDKSFGREMAYVMDYGQYKKYLLEEMNNKDIVYTKEILDIGGSTEFPVKENDAMLMLYMVYPSGIFGADLDWEGNKTMVIYDKADKEFYALKVDKYYNKVGFVNDIDKGAPFMPNFFCGNLMFDCIEAIDFIDYAEKSGSEEMKRVAATLNEESNPVLVMATLK